VVAIFQVRRDSRRPEGVIADLGLDTGGAGAPADHGVGVGLGQRSFGELPGRAADRAKERHFGMGGNPATVEIGAQIGLKIVVARHFMALTPFSRRRTHSYFPAQN